MFPPPSIEGIGDVAVSVFETHKVLQLGCDGVLRHHLRNRYPEWRRIFEQEHRAMAQVNGSVKVVV
jgi:hypothetical protein